MDVTAFTDPAPFADQVRPVIDRHPARSSILATVLDQAVNGHPIDDALWLLIGDRAGPVAAAMHTPPWNLYLTPLPDDARGKAIEVLADVLVKVGRDLPGITASPTDARAFADAWQQRVGGRPRLALRELLYEIRDVPPPPDPAAVPGASRIATEQDVRLIARWLDAFNLEALPDRDPVDGQQLVRRRLARGWYVLWELPEQDGEPVSVAGLSLAGGIARIGPVYTPGPWRRRGYAGAATRVATRLGFEQGASRCVLYADAANPTANGIYQTIGYRLIGEAQMIAFR
jgi:predicted GNAT family acetyltransferase